MVYRRCFYAVSVLDNIMRPTPGQPYTVVAGDSLRSISRRAYGRDQGVFLRDANARVLQGHVLSDEGLPVLQVGDVLDIPETTRRYPERTITADFETDITLIIGAKRFRGVTATTIERGMNSIADLFKVSVPFDPRDRSIVDALRPFGYQRATLLIGGEAYITAQIAKISFSATTGGNVASLECRTIPGDMIECMSDLVAPEWSNNALLDIGDEIARRYSMRAFSADIRINDAIFPYVTKEVTESDFSFLSRLASQKGFLLTSSADGDLLFTRAAVDDRPVAALQYGQFPVKQMTADYDGTKRHSRWYGYAEVASGQPATSLYRDPSISSHRPFAFQADESDADSIEAAVLWRAGKSIADATTTTVVLAGWRNPDGQLWAENMKVSLVAPEVGIFTESDYITQVVSLTKDDGGGDVAALNLVLPGAYNSAIPDTFPWEGYAE